MHPSACCGELSVLCTVAINRRSVDLRSETPTEPPSATRPPPYGISSNARFSKKQLLDIYDTLLQKLGSQLPVPEDADMTYPGMLRCEYESSSTSKKGKDADEEDNEEGEEISHAAEHNSASGLSLEEIDSDMWMYRDPEGNVQGPFGKNELMGWWEEGYFPPDLPVRAANGSDDQWLQLKQLLNLWRPPPGFPQNKQESRPASAAVPDPSVVQAASSISPVETPSALAVPAAPSHLFQSGLADHFAAGHVPEGIHGNWQQVSGLNSKQPHPFNNVQQSLDALNPHSGQLRRTQQGLDLGPQVGRPGQPLQHPSRTGTPDAVQSGMQYGPGTGLHHGARQGDFLPPGVVAHMQGLVRQHPQHMGVQPDVNGAFQRRDQPNPVFPMDLGMDQRNQLGGNMNAAGLLRYAGQQERAGGIGRGGMMSPEPQAILQAMRNQNAQANAARLDIMSQGGANMIGGNLARLMGERPVGGMRMPQQPGGQQGWSGNSSGGHGLGQQMPPVQHQQLQHHHNNQGLADLRQGMGMGAFADQRLSAALRNHSNMLAQQGHGVRHVGFDPQVPPPQNVSVNGNAAPGRPTGLPFMGVDQAYMPQNANMSQGTTPYSMQLQQQQSHLQHLHQQQQLQSPVQQPQNIAASQSTGTAHYSTLL